MKKFLMMVLMLSVMVSPVFADVICELQTYSVDQKVFQGYGVVVRHDGREMNFTLDYKPGHNLKLSLEENGQVKHVVGRVLRVRSLYTYNPTNQTRRVCRQVASIYTTPSYTNNDALAALTFGAVIGGLFTHNHFKYKKHRRRGRSYRSRNFRKFRHGRNRHRTHGRNRR